MFLSIGLTKLTEFVNSVWDHHMDDGVFNSYWIDYIVVSNGYHVWFNEEHNIE